MRISLVRLVLAASLFASACATDHVDGGGGGSGSGSGGASAPAAGQWLYAETTPVSSTCPGNIDHGEAGDFVIDQLGSSSFRIVPADGTAPFVCNLSSAGFDCPDRLAMTDSYPNATVNVHATAAGAFSVSTRGTGHQDATVTCTGSGCGALGVNAFPCTFKVNFEIRAY